MVLFMVLFMVQCMVWCMVWFMVHSNILICKGLLLWTVDRGWLRISNFLWYPMFFLSLTTWDDLGHFADTQGYLGFLPEPYTGCPKKNALFLLKGHRGHQEWTSFLMSTKSPHFCQKMTEKNEFKVAYPPWEKACFWITLKIFFFCSHFSDRLG